MEAQLAMAVREELINEGVDTSKLYIRTIDYAVLPGNVYRTTIEIVDESYNASRQIFHIVEAATDFFKVI